MLCVFTMVRSNLQVNGMAPLSQSLQISAASTLTYSHVTTVDAYRTTTFVISMTTVVTTAMRTSAITVSRPTSCSEGVYYIIKLCVPVVDAI